MTQEIDYLATAVYAWFVRIYRRLWADQTRFLQQYGITPSQFGVMAVLMQEDAMTFTELSRRTVLHGSTLTGIIDRLEEKGLVVRVNDAHDRRQIQLSMTAKAREVFRGIPTIDENGLLCTVLKALSDEERQSLLCSLGRLGEEMGEEAYSDLISSVYSLRRATEDIS
jgi:DNA-binding MarR family transcriptional regulator